MQFFYILLSSATWALSWMKQKVSCAIEFLATAACKAMWALFQGLT